MSKLLGDFISDIRTAPTRHERRRLIAVELTDIRGKIKEENPNLLPRIVAKLMYLTLIGENTNFSQMASISLMSHERFSYKQIGYLGAQLIVDQTSDLCVLLSHTVLKDLQNPKTSIRLLALNIIANTEIPEMCRNCAVNVEKLVGSSYFREAKSAIAAATRIVKVAPDLVSIFMPHVLNLLSSNEHAVTLATVTFCLQVYDSTQEDTKLWPHVANTCQNILLNLFQKRNVHEYTRTTFNDPILQTRILRLLGEIGIPNKSLDDLLLQIITNLDLKKGVARMILYEAVETIQRVSKDHSLHTMALNQIGKLFHLPYPNIVYSSLCAFSRVLYKEGAIVDRTSSESQVLGRYKEDVVKFLTNRDPSIRRRSLDVLVALIDKDNITSLTPEIVSYLPLTDNDFRAEIIFKIFTSIQRFAPSKKWNFDAVLDLIIVSGNYVANEIIVRFSNLIGRTPSIQGYAILKLKEAIVEHSTNQSLVQISAWVLGEFCDDADDVLVQELMEIQKLPQTTVETASYLITAIAKIALRENMIELAMNYFKGLMSSNSLELQQHAGEAFNILRNPDLRDFLLAPIEFDEEASSITPYCSEALVDTQSSYSAAPQKIKPSTQLDAKSLLDLILKPTFTPPAGGKEVIKSHDFVVYFEITKNATNNKQVAIRASVFNITTSFSVLKNFRLQFGVQTGWVAACKEPSSIELLANGTPIQQVLLLENRGNDPLSMKVLATYQIDGRPVTTTEHISAELLRV